MMRPLLASIFAASLLPAMPLLAQTQARSAPAKTASSPKKSLADTLQGEAKAEYAAARILYDDGDFAGALTKLEAAYRLSQDPRLLWNMAAAQKNLRHYSKVIDLLERYLAADPTLVSDEDREQAKQLMEVANGFVTTVTFDVKPAGADIVVDGQSLGVAPLPGPVRIDFGQRHLKILKAGFVPEERDLSLDGGHALTVQVALKEEVHQGSLKVVTDPNSTIRLDGKMVGIGAWQGVLPSGSHSLQLEGDQKVPRSMDVVISDGETRTVEAPLQDAATASKGGIPTWLWVTGGVAAAALGTGAYFVLHKNNDAPAVQEGTWGTLEL